MEPAGTVCCVASMNTFKSCTDLTRIAHEGPLSSDDEPGATAAVAQSAVAPSMQVVRREGLRPKKSRPMPDDATLQTNVEAILAACDDIERMQLTLQRMVEQDPHKALQLLRWGWRQYWEVKKEIYNTFGIVSALLLGIATSMLTTPLELAEIDDMWRDYREWINGAYVSAIAISMAANVIGTWGCLAVIFWGNSCITDPDDIFRFEEIVPGSSWAQKPTMVAIYMFFFGASLIPVLIYPGPLGTVLTIGCLVGACAMFTANVRHMRRWQKLESANGKRRQSDLRIAVAEGIKQSQAHAGTTWGQPGGAVTSKTQSPPFETRIAAFEPESCVTRAGT